jgi:hypothetical protein
VLNQAAASFLRHPRAPKRESGSAAAEATPRTYAHFLCLFFANDQCVPTGKHWSKSTSHPAVAPVEYPEGV